MPHRIMPVAAPRPPAGFGAGQPTPQPPSAFQAPPAPTAPRPPALVQVPRKLVDAVLPPAIAQPVASTLPVLQPGMKVSLAPQQPSQPSAPPQGPFNPPRIIVTDPVPKTTAVKPAALTGKVSVATSEGTGTIEQLRASHDKVMRVRNAFIEMVSAVLDVIKG